jgi:hypothetical protein
MSEVFTDCEEMT